MTTIAADRLALAVPLEQAAADVAGRSARVPTSSTSSGVPSGPVARTAIVLEVGRGPGCSRGRGRSTRGPHISRMRPPTSLFDCADGGDHVRQRDAVGAQPVGIDGDLVLLLVAADAGDLGDAGHAAERVAQGEVLERAQLVEAVLAGLVDERVLEDPADAGGVRARASGVTPFGQACRGGRSGTRARGCAPSRRRCPPRRRRRRTTSRTSSSRARRSPAARRAASEAIG